MTPQDLKQISNLFDKKTKSIDLNILELRSQILWMKHEFSFSRANDNRIEKKIDNLIDNLTEWKSQLFNNIDGLAIEIRDSREYREIGSYQTTNNTDRIEKLEKTIFGTVSSA